MCVCARERKTNDAKIIIRSVDSIAAVSVRISINRDSFGYNFMLNLNEKANQFEVQRVNKNDRKKSALKRKKQTKKRNKISKILMKQLDKK